jgi:hypothetical protein
VFNHAADLVLRGRRLLATTLRLFRFLCGALSRDYFNFIDYYWHLKLLRLISRKGAKNAKAFVTPSFRRAFAPLRLCVFA